MFDVLPTVEQGNASVDATAGRAPGISVYSGASLGPVTDVMSYPEFPPGIVEQFDISFLLAGTVVDVVFEDSRPDGFSLTNIRLAPDFILPAHHHDVDCLYYVQCGWILLGRRRIDPGGGFLVLAERPYGYRAGPEGATVLEFRLARSFNMVVTETSPAKWKEMVGVAEKHANWPGFTESVALPTD